MTNDVKRPLESVDCPFCGNKAFLLADGVRDSNEIPIVEGVATKFAVHATFWDGSRVVFLTNPCSSYTTDPRGVRVAQSSNIPSKFLDEDMCSN